MPLAQYSDLYWYPSGAVSANVEARVFLERSNTFANLYTDGTGSTLLPNPTTTDAGGVLTFWAEEGEYWIRINDESFRVSVGSPNIDVFEAGSSDLSTGVLSGADLDPNGSNPAAINISPTVGYVMDYLTDPEIPGYIRVSTPAMTVALVGASLTRVITWWLFDSTGAVIQQAVRPTNIQRRTHLVLGATGYDMNTGQINIIQSLPVIYPQLGNQLADLMDSLGPFSITGNIVSPNGANLSLDLLGGDVFSRAFNYSGPGGITNNPHVSPIASQTAATFRRLTQISQFPAPPQVTTLNPAQYDVGGVLTPVTGNNATIQRVWAFPANAPGDQIAVQYGQSQYTSLTAALDQLGSRPYTVNPTVAGNAALIGYIAVLGTATALNNTAQCVIRRADKLDFP